MCRKITLTICEIQINRLNVLCEGLHQSVRGKEKPTNIWSRVGSKNIYSVFQRFRAGGSTSAGSKIQTLTRFTRNTEHLTFQEKCLERLDSALNTDVKSRECRRHAESVTCKTSGSFSLGCSESFLERTRWVKEHCSFQLLALQALFSTGAPPAPLASACAACTRLHHLHPPALPAPPASTCTACTTCTA